METKSLRYPYPERLIATSPAPMSRILYVEGDAPPCEVTWSTFLSQFSNDDVLVVNDTRVIPARIFSEDARLDSQVGVLFVRPLKNLMTWEVLLPLRQLPKDGSGLKLPGGIELRVCKAGLPQVVELSQPLPENYFQEFGDMPLPPYIQKARQNQRTKMQDRSDYQSIFAEQLGSLAAPTASLHFKDQHLKVLKDRGVEVLTLTLHVGLGTFLPIHSDNLDAHIMHKEWFEITDQVAERILRTQKNGGRVWALGTTVTRALESWALTSAYKQGRGITDESELFIRPGFEFKVVDALLTNFHQPESTLLALVGAFAGLERVLGCYQWAIERSFRLFSYGDLSVWIPKHNEKRPPL